MRFTIVLALCFIGAVSAGSLNKRSFIDDFQNNTQNAFHAFEQFGQSFNEKVQEALKNLLSSFGNKPESTEASVSVSKRETIYENIQNFSDEAKQKAAEALKNLLSFIEQFKTQSNESSDAVNVAKRETSPLDIIADLGRGDVVKFAQDFLKLLTDVANIQGRRKRESIHENIQNLSDEAKHKAAEAFKNLLSFIEQFKNQSS